MKNKNNIANTDINKIISFLKDNVDNVNLNDFKLEINGLHKTYYDFVLYVNNIKSIDSNYLENIKNANNFDHYTILSTGKYFDIQTRKLYTTTEVISLLIMLKA